MKKLLATIYRKLSGRKAGLSDIYQTEDYLEAYRRHTDARVDRDPRAAIGGNWEAIGKLQFDFLRARGLQTQHHLLDIGCGTLRGGRHFIDFLDPQRYTGMDISPKAIAFATTLVQQEGLTAKAPRLLVSEEKNLKFTALAGQSYDYLLAQSVFTHLKPAHIEECFAHVGQVMHEDSQFFFTYFQSEAYTEINHKDFSYPRTFFENLARKYDFACTDWTAAYDHPRQQRMLAIQKQG